MAKDLGEAVRLLMRTGLGQRRRTVSAKCDLSISYRFDAGTFWIQALCIRDTFGWNHSDIKSVVELNLYQANVGIGYESATPNLGRLCAFGKSRSHANGIFKKGRFKGFRV